jgi:predicted methyltransferase
MEPQAWLKTLYAAMKPGAVVGVVDHAAKAGSDPRASVEAMHRIDPAVVKADFKRAGFVLVGESDMLRNPADDHSIGVFDKRIRGKTDRFVLKFKKPRK